MNFKSIKNPNVPTRRQIKRYGWIPSLPDKRDLVFSALNTTGLPKLVDLRAKCPAIYNQGNLGSCTANALAGIFEFEMMRQNLPSIFLPSRLFIYYNERVIEGTVDTDSGAELRDGMKTLAKQGVCPETMWPYVISRFTNKPTPTCYKAALKNLAVKYMRVRQDLNQLKGTLAMGIPVVFGFTVYDSFESPTVAKTGIVPMPGPDEGVLGGHAVILVGYDDAKKMFIVRNSWGTKWGLKGYFYMPYAYVTDTSLCSDFWMIQSVS